MKSANGETYQVSLYPNRNVDKKVIPCYIFNMIGIYKITNTINGRIYIGASVDLKRRFAEHKTPKSNFNKKLASDIKEFGIENFKFEILQECKKEELKELELQYIKKLNPYYNTIGKSLKKETKKAISKTVKNWWENLDEETRNKIITNNLTGPKKGHIVSETTREKLRLANLGKKQSEETREKRRLTMIEKKKAGWKHSNDKNKKKVICVETGKIFNSVKETAEFYNVIPSNISAVLKGRQQTCKGHHFKYVV